MAGGSGNNLMNTRCKTASTAYGVWISIRDVLVPSNLEPSLQSVALVPAVSQLYRMAMCRIIAFLHRIKGMSPHLVVSRQPGTGLRIRSAGRGWTYTVWFVYIKN